jgi:hypothetical protein
MPYFHVYDDSDYEKMEAEDFTEQEGDLEYSYESASARYSPETLEPPARAVHDALRTMGITIVRCHYDGGGDEGFADFREAIRDGEVIGLESLCEQLKEGPVGDVPEKSWIYPDSYLAGLSRIDRVRQTLDHFAFGLASQLLGEGYGTGEYTMYGDFRADLRTGEIADEEGTPETRKPPQDRTKLPDFMTDENMDEQA